MEKIEKTETTSTESSLKVPENKEGIGLIHKTFTSYLLSRKLWATVFSISLLWLMFWKQIDYLFAFSTYTPEMAAILVPAFTGLVRDIMVCFTAIIGAFLGISGLVQWKHGTESIVNQAASFIKEKYEEKIDKTEKIEYTEHVDESAQNKNLKEFKEE